MKGMTLRIRRIRRGLTQADLAERLGVSQVLISKLERGIYEASKETISKLRQIFREIDEYGKANEERNL